MADATRPELDLSKLSTPIEIARTDIARGELSSIVVDEYFSKDQYKEDQAIDVLLAPIVAYPKIEHGVKGGAQSNELVPLWVPARLCKDGRLQVNPGACPWIPRSYLKPCSPDIIPLGTVEGMDEFLSTHRCREESWSEYWNYTLDLFRSVTGQALDEFKHEHYIRSDQSIIVDDSIKQGMSKSIINLYDDLVLNREIPPLLKRYASLDDAPVEPLLNEQESVLQSAEHFGQMSNEFPVSDSQRETIHHFLTLGDGEMLAVNGPPGTGKTTLLQSIVSTLWIKAAYEQTEPPIIVVSSTNNQAVTNVIDSFGRITEVHNSLQGRWIPDILSYGLYLSSQQQKENPNFHTVLSYKMREKKPAGFMTKIETPEFVAEAQQYFLEKCCSYAGTVFETMEDAVYYLHCELKRSVEEKKQIIHSYHEFLRVTKLEREKYPHGIQPVLTAKTNQIVQLEKDLKEITQVEIEWNQHLFEKPWWMTFLDFYPLNAYVSKKRKLRNDGFILARGYEGMEEDEFTTFIQSEKNSLKQQIENTRVELVNIQKDQQWFADVRNQWNDWQNKLGLNSNDDLLSKLDISYRYISFKLATHYWEGRWILQMQEEFSTNYEETRGKLKQETRWRRYAKLTPCFVSTLYMAPSFFSAYQGKYMPLYEFIDLLIIDEAGQVCPEVAGATFALAKKALVVGDTLQIEPIWSIPKSIDLKNMEKFNLATSYSDAEEKILSKYIGASNGSVMHIAQRASKYQKFDDVRGMFLTEHRRCVPEIIGYCNELAYKGRLVPKRGGLTDFSLPHMGYAHVQGMAERFGGSYRNRIEADVIVNWIVDNMQRLMEMYPGKKVGEIIGIVTPFAQQRQFILSALKAAKVTGVTVGTVHALQGAERPIILFSPVYDSSKKSGYFFDNGINMMNVAVSRAKDSFLVFGDMGIFDVNSSAPSGLLANYLFADEANEIKNIKIPSRVLSSLSGAVQHIRELNDHRRVLRDCIVATKKEIHIVSPFLSSEAIEADRLQEIFAEQIRNGVKVTVYTDEKLNEQNGKQKFHFTKAKEMLHSVGVNVVIADRIHNKTLWLDNRLLIEGSFNWLSARRNPDDPWCRYETSLVYKGDGVEQMIQQIVSDLEMRKR